MAPSQGFAVVQKSENLYVRILLCLLAVARSCHPPVNSTITSIAIFCSSVGISVACFTLTEKKANMMKARSPETPPPKKARITTDQDAHDEEAGKMIKHSDMVDPSDRAQACRTGSLVRVHLDMIGVRPENRAGCGLNPRHVHEVAADCLANITKQSRYKHVDIIEIPAHLKEKILKANATMCESDPLMPKFSPDIKYVCVTKTHFTHAQKLAKDGNRALFNNGARIIWQKDDGEGRDILNDGPECCIYRAELLNDSEAVTALANEDNMDAEICWGEDEMQAFGRIDIIFCKLAPSQDEVPKLNIMLNELNRAGLGNFPEKSWKDMCALRYKLSTASADVLKNCQFLIVASQRRVRSDDFEMVSRLGVGCL